MKAIGYVRCAECGELCRGYKPRGYKQGDQLATWQHGAAGVFQGGAFRRGRLRCDGSYRRGVDSRLDADLLVSAS